MFFPIFLSVVVPAAFSTRLSEDTELGDNAVIFDTVDLNIGGGYDEFTGKKLFKLSVVDLACIFK